MCSHKLLCIKITKLTVRHEWNQHIKKKMNEKLLEN